MAGERSGGDAFSIEDYFALKHITQVALSPDGKRVAYVVHRGTIATFFSDKLSSREKRDVRTVYVQSPVGRRAAIAVDAAFDAQELTWSSDSRELAFISARKGVAQVFLYDTTTGEIRQRTQSPDPVLSFRFAPDGRCLAYVTRAESPPSAGLYSQILNGDHGIVMDSNSLSIYDFVNPDHRSLSQPLPAVMRISLEGNESFEVKISGTPKVDVHSYHWEPNGRLLSVTYVGNDIKPSLLGSYRTSLGVFDIDTRQFRAIGEAIEPQGERAGTRYSGGEWVPHTNKLLVRRVTEIEPWVSPNYPDWAIVDLASRLPNDAIHWRPVATYGIGTVFFPVSDSRVLVEKTHEGVHSLFNLVADDDERADIVAGLDGSSSLLSFSADFSTAVFVNESLTRPPELFVRQKGRPARKLTELNSNIARRVRHKAREITWKSADGVRVHGWLLEPVDSAKGPRPMITHVHGGPAFVYPNAFAPYFEIWPFPLEVQAAQGMTIFVPNYRGTESYGRVFASPKRADREPVDDVITGVRQLVAGGIADPKRLGIMGQSHGAWLGPMVMTREKVFRASSFAEGYSNEVLMYSLMSGDLNRQVHDVVMGASLWDDPQLYLEGSPDMYFKGVRTASLWEAGARSEAVVMFNYPKAARRFGAPCEFVVYPKTEHTPDNPNIQRESANRNLDWFDFWLNGKERTEPEKVDQYERWKALLAASSWEGEHASDRACDALCWLDH